jgi:hypothetical protein
VELTDGYLDEAELLAQDGVRNGVLAPFPNRIADGRYRFAGQDHDLLPGHGRLARPEVYHGFARGTEFELADARTEPHGARLTFRSTGIRPGRHPGYPFSIDLDVSYRITADGIGVEVLATNTGPDPAPYAAGWHPYFRLASAIDELTLQIPADTLIRTDQALIPFEGPDTFLALEHCPPMDFRRPRRLGAAVIDACYGGLRPGPGDRQRTADLAAQRLPARVHRRHAREGPPPLHRPRTGRDADQRVQPGGLRHGTAHRARRAAPVRVRCGPPLSRGPGSRARQLNEVQRRCSWHPHDSRCMNVG